MGRAVDPCRLLAHRPIERGTQHGDLAADRAVGNALARSALVIGPRPEHPRLQIADVPLDRGAGIFEPIVGLDAAFSSIDIAVENFRDRRLFWRERLLCPGDPLVSPDLGRRALCCPR
jgi:hypothetical protein